MRAATRPTHLSAIFTLSSAFTSSFAFVIIHHIMPKGPKTGSSKGKGPSKGNEPTGQRKENWTMDDSCLQIELHYKYKLQNALAFEGPGAKLRREEAWKKLVAEFNR